MIACPRKETSDNFSRLSEIKRIEERSIWFVIIKSSFIASYIIGRKWDGRNIELSRAALTYNEIYLALCSVPKLLRNKFFYDKVTEHALPYTLFRYMLHPKGIQLLERSTRLAPSFFYNAWKKFPTDHRQMLSIRIDRSIATRGRGLQSSAKSMSFPHFPRGTRSPWTFRGVNRCNRDRRGCSRLRIFPIVPHLGTSGRRSGEWS